MSSRGGAERSRGRQKRINQIFERHYEGGESCGFCPEKRAEFVLEEREAEGLSSRYLCRECFSRWQDIEAAIDMIYKGLKVGRQKLVSEGVQWIRKEKARVTFDQLSRAIDLIRESGEKQHLLRFKDALTKYLLQRFGDRLNVVIRHDPKYNNVRITWVGEHSWSCHLPEDQLTGRFREMVLATR